MIPEQQKRIDDAINGRMGPEDAHAILAQAVTDLRSALSLVEKDGERLDWLEAHHYEAVSLAVGKAWPKQPLRDAVDSAIDAARSSTEGNAP